MAEIKEVVIDRDACQGVGGCVIASEGAFEIDDEGKAVLTGPIDQFDPEKLVAAVRACPFVAISTVEEERD